MNSDLIKAEPKPYIRPTKVLRVKDIDSRILELHRLIEKERNSKEKVRLVDEQAALKFTLRVIDAYTTRGQCVR